MKYLSCLGHLSPLLLQRSQVLVIFYAVNKWNLPKPHPISTEDVSRAEERKLFLRAIFDESRLLISSRSFSEKPRLRFNFLNIHDLLGA
jgi:hypothetical protein